MTKSKIDFMLGLNMIDFNKEDSFFRIGFHKSKKFYFTRPLPSPDRKGWILNLGCIFFVWSKEGCNHIEDWDWENGIVFCKICGIDLGGFDNGDECN